MVVTVNGVADPGFEVLSSNAWTPMSEYNNGTVTVHSTANHHSGSYAAMLSAVNNTLRCPSECKDTVRAQVEQFVQFNTPSIPTLKDIVNSGDSFSAWWYLAPSSLPTYALHIGLDFSDNSTIEYWYGHSDLNNTRYNLGPIPAIGSWFQMKRNLASDIQGVVADPSSAKVRTIWFGAFGGSFAACTTCPSTPHGETAWVDDAALNFNIVDNGPVAAFYANPAGGTGPLTVSFNAAQSYVPGATSGSIASYRWDFGDGTPVVTVQGAVTNHTFSGPGTFTVTLTVMDDNNVASTPTSTIIKVDPADITVPVLAAGAGGLVLGGLVYARFRRRRSKPRKT